MAKPTARALDEALEWFRARVPVTDEEFQAISARARKLSFSIAQIEQLRIVDSVQKSLERAIRDGVGLARWKKEIGPALRRAWGPGRRNRAGRVFNQGQRLELIYRNAMQGAYNAGRMRALRQPALRAVRPVWVFDAVMDSKTTKLICRPLDGTTLPATDPFWDTHVPPLHFSCRSGIRSISQRAAMRRGLTTEIPRAHVQEGFGTAPDAGPDEIAANLEGVSPRLRELFEVKTRLPAA